MIYFKISVQKVLFITLLCVSITNGNHFIYEKTPIELIESARNLGITQRNLMKEFISQKNIIPNSDEETEIINHFLNKCHEYSQKVGYDEEYIKFLESVALSEVDSHPTSESHYHHPKILDLMSLDDATISFLTTPINGMKKILQRQCLINEVDFQCVDSFFGANNHVTSEKIDIIRSSGGFAKLMLDEECPNNGDDLNDYHCIGTTAKEYGKQCSTSLKFYNMTKYDVDHKILNLFASAISEIDKFNDILEKTNDLKERIKIKRDTEILLSSTLKTISQMEGSKCRLFYQLGKCLKSSVTNLCGKDAGRKFEIMIQVGYLRRERFNDINDAFLALNMEPHRSCGNLY
uniref:Secreted protein n=1 Tax=Strongyloides papillosus TaxID=174720 RepID=A0A0N5CAU8_STREA